ncbi:class I SAM-dependent methyltransferase [Bordetella flabilis]|uniref:class I SAM-dependent methyltransferase n=1 Tax=Bordetella flabilis TaxID=463014 RepID=UPI0009FEA922|nr:class I SAM-dependent methyltransferase [Bordetella flabilis]
MTRSSSSQFDELPGLYEDMAKWPFRKEIETPSVLEALGSVEGRNVLDFGCGDGTYSRILKRLGAARVVGFDVAEGMLGHARERERETPLGIDYVSQLDRTLDCQFDLVLSVYVMPYATDKKSLENMCCSMARVLKPGGRLITLPIHPDFDPDPAYYAAYGFSLTQRPAHDESAPIRLDLFFSDFRATVTAFYWSFQSLESALQAAGFSPVQRKNPRPAKYADLDQAPPLLHAYLRRPHAVILECTRSDSENK